MSPHVEECSGAGAIHQSPKVAQTATHHSPGPFRRNPNKARSVSMRTAALAATTAITPRRSAFAASVADKSAPKL